MKSIQNAVDEMLLSCPLISSLISRDLINLTSLARELQKDVEIATQKSCQTSAIAMSLKRSPIISDTNIDFDFRSQISALHLRKDLVELTYHHSPSIYKSLARLTRLMETREKQLFTITQGVKEVMICAPIHNAFQIKEMFSHETLLLELSDLVSLTLALNEDSIKILGLYASLLTQISFLGVAIVDIVSTPNELTLILKSTDTNKVLSVFSS